ncbi:MAG TPA: flagellar motor switch protein FliM [Thermoclostridium caenicola]|nr:flagellar motor switch protein FliM [Thermoclostridium caenicola]
MGDILSQNEIDRLLAQLNAGELDVKEFTKETAEKKVRNHDFRRPSKFAKDHIRTLSIINENYARLLTNFLSGYLRTLVQVDVQTVQPLQYSEFTNSIANPAVLGIVNFDPLPGSIIFEINPSIAYSLIDRILGGKGVGIDRVRGFTEIELAILMRLMTQMLSLMREPWENVTDIRPSLDRIETNAQFAQLMSPNEMVALVTFTAKIGDVEGFLNICIPHMVVEPVMPKLSTKLWFSLIEKGSTQETRGSIELRVRETDIPVTAILGRTTLSVQEFLMLQEGDVLMLNTNINGKLEVYAGDILKFYGKPGVRNKKNAVKITEIVRSEDD